MTDAGSPEAPLRWSVAPGMTLLRRELHEMYGGSRQDGIVTFRTIPDIVVFTDPQGAGHGYATFEGPQQDGSYSYTGAGQVGAQVFKRGNRALRDSGPDGRPIRLFTTAETRVTYIGEFATGEPTYRAETIQDRDGNPRPGIIFKLVPVDANMARLTDARPSLVQPFQVSRWHPPEFSDVVVQGTDAIIPGERVVTRIEFALQTEFGEWLVKQGTAPSRLLLETEIGTIEPDLYVESLGWIVEAKRSTSREHVRMAVGQVLDYAFVARRAGLSAVPVLLLPGYPGPTMSELIGELGITLAIRDGVRFSIVGPYSPAPGK